MVITINDNAKTHTLKFVFVRKKTLSGSDWPGGHPLSKLNCAPAAKKTKTL